MERFCPRCGKETEHLIKGFCTECYLLKHEVIDIAQELQIDFCRKCSRIKISGIWMEENEKAIAEFIRGKAKLKEIADESIEVSLEPLDEGRFNARLKLSGKIGNEPVVVEREILLKPKRVQCDDCVKLSGSYHEAIIQVRMKAQDEEILDSIKKMAERMLLDMRNSDRLAVVVQELQNKNGFDLLIGSGKAARLIAEAVARKYRIRLKKSSKLVGRTKSGKEKKRLTYCIKF